MIQHPSVTAAFEGPARLRPQERMDAYAPCWCHSGKKFKWCHFRRDRQRPVNIFENEQGMMAAFRQGYCSHPDAGAACSGKITAAHTVQRRGGLAAISEDRHVFTVKVSLGSLIEHKGTPEPRRIGIGQASVFPGFCNYHDSTTFKPIEGPEIALDRVSAFLFAYRTICYERFSKAAALKAVEHQREMDCGQPFWKQVLMQEFLHAHSYGLAIGMRDVDTWKGKYDAQLLSTDMMGFNFYAVQFDRVLPLVGCGAFHPEYDFSGNVLQRLGRRPFDFEHVSLTITAFAGKTVAFFGWLGDCSGPASQFVASYRVLADSRKADALVQLAFEHLENIYLTPNWWGGLSVADQEELKRRIQSGTSLVERKSDCLLDRGTTYVSAGVLESAVG